MFFGSNARHAFGILVAVACLTLSYVQMREFIRLRNNRSIPPSPHEHLVSLPPFDAKSTRDRYTSSYILGRPWYYHKHQLFSFSTNCRTYCHFKNVCITKSHGQKSHLTVKIFRHPLDAGYLLLIDGNGEELFNYPDNYCYRDLLGTKLGYEVSNSSTNTNRFLSEYDYILSPGTSIRDFNFGHHLWEYLLPHISLADMFGFDLRRTVLLNIGSSSERYGEYDNLIADVNCLKSNYSTQT